MKAKVNNPAMTEAMKKAFEKPMTEWVHKELSLLRFHPVWITTTMLVAAVGVYSLGGTLAASTAAPALMIPIVTGIFGCGIGLLMASLETTVHSVVYDYITPAISGAYDYLASWFASEEEPTVAA